MYKIFIVSIDREKVASMTDRLIQLDDQIHVAKMFTTDVEDEVNQYISIDDMYLCYKNNDVLCVKTDKNDCSTGYTVEEYEKSDIICVDYELYNIMSQRKIKKDLVVWIDTNKIHSSPKMIRYAKEFIELTHSRHVLYFNSEDPDDLIISNMMNWVSGNEHQRKEIENNCK